jgi:hypothetical protein
MPLLNTGERAARVSDRLVSRPSSTPRRVRGVCNGGEITFTLSEGG